MSQRPDNWNLWLNKISMGKAKGNHATINHKINHGNPQISAITAVKYIGINSLPGKEDQQMSPDCHPVSVSKTNNSVDGVKLLGTKMT